MTLITLQKNDTLLEIGTEGAYIKNVVSNNTNILFPAQKIGEKLRGGIPLCAPVFGPGEVVGLNQHGFARDVEWVVLQKSDDSVTLRFDAANHSDIPEQYRGCGMMLAISVAEKRLSMNLLVENNGVASVVCSPGFHPYFPTSDATNVLVLANKEYRFDVEQLAATQFLPPGQRQTEVNLDNLKVTLKSDTLQRYAVWSANPDKYICVEPTWAGNLADQPSVPILEPGEQREFTMTLSWEVFL